MGPSDRKEHGRNHSRRVAGPQYGLEPRVRGADDDPQPSKRGNYEVMREQVRGIKGENWTFSLGIIILASGGDPLLQPEGEQISVEEIGCLRGEFFPRGGALHLGREFRVPSRR